MRAKRSYSLLPAGFIAAAVLAGCNAILGLNELSIDTAGADGSTGGSGGSGGGSGGSGGSSMMDVAPDNFVGECVSNVECTDRATAAAIDAGTLSDAGDGGARVVPAICMKPEGRCVELLSEDCHEVTGNYRDDDAIILGTLFSTTGDQALTNLQRQRSATLAAEEINMVGGVPAASGAANPRPLVMVSCDEAAMLLRAAGHLVNDLHVPAIVGPNTSQDTIDLSNKLTVAAGTVLMTPTGVASSIAALNDNDLTWLMVPSDVQRAPLMIKQLTELETQVRMAHPERTTVKLGIVFRNDALGIGTRSSLNDLTFNGQPLSHPINIGTGGAVTVDGYEFGAADQNALVASYVTFAPDIIVLAGTAEAITKVMEPLETRWTAPTRPYYMLIDSVKVPDLIRVAANAELRGRIRGTGITPAPSSVAVLNAFNVDYRVRYGSPPTASGVGPSYDATYAIAFALAATRDLPVTGANIAKGLRRLAGGMTTVEVMPSRVLAGFQKLASGENITGVGTFVPLDWNSDGAVVSGTIEMWCIGAPTGAAAYQSSGLTFDIKSAAFSGMYTQCSP
jgi:ABC-type branched-subunit amino acid transport system substrate-binding protein